MKFDIHYFDSVETTMDIARDMAVGGAPEGGVVQAGAQDAGRGRRGNQWVSPKGNLYQTFLLRPIVPRQDWGQLSFVIAVALADSVDAVCYIHKDQMTINLKWPNDVLMNGQKLAGILIEAADGFVIVGTGVNIKICPDDRSKISDVCDISVNDFRDIFLDKIALYYDQWQVEGFTPIRDRWMERAYHLGQEIQARLPNHIYEGVFENLDERGILLLREKDGYLRQIHSGEIIVHGE